MKDRCLLLFFFGAIYAISSNSNDTCHTTYNNTIMKHEEHITCENYKCTFEILPLDNYAVKVHFLKGWNFEEIPVRETFIYKDTLQNIAKGTIRNSYMQMSYTTVLNGGFIFEYLPKNVVKCDSDSSYFRFSRIIKDEEAYCGPVLKKIGRQPIVIQQTKVVREYENCPYRLVPNSTKNTMDTLLVSHFNGDVQYEIDGEKKYKKLYHNAVVKNWTSVDILAVSTTTPNEYYVYRVAQITAVSVPEGTCECGANSIFIRETSSLNIRAPGFHNILCPGLECSTNITFPQTTISANMVRRVLVDLDMIALDGVSLSIVSKSLNVKWTSNSFTRFEASFLLDNNNLNLNYSTPPYAISAGPNGHYQMNISTVTIPKHCDCSTFMSRQYTEEEKHVTAQVVIPEDCALMYCEWNLKAWEHDPKREVIIEINTQEYIYSDEIFVFTKSVMERYNGPQLYYPKKLHLADCDSGATISFLRKELGKETTIKVSWAPKKLDQCSGRNHILVTKKKQSFISPNYPKTYNPNSDCEFVFEAPEKQTIVVHIHEIDLENVHDHLSFYDGISDESERLQYFTGTHKDVVLSSTGNILLARFHSDIIGSNRGYNFVVFTEESAEISQHSPSYAFRYLWGLFFFTLILGCAALTLFVYKKKKSHHGHFQPFGNAMVHFQSEDTNSTVTIDQ